MAQHFFIDWPVAKHLPSGMRRDMAIIASPFTIITAECP